MADILLLFSTTDGQTLRICQRLEHVLVAAGHRTTLVSLDDDREIDLRPFDKIVIGASIRYGKHSRRVFEFIDRHLPLLESKANAFFSVNIVARKPEKNQPETNPYVRKFLRQTAWRPRQVAVFAGKLDYPRYRFLDRLMIRLIMLITQGPTNPAQVYEFTDWQKVVEFGSRLGEI